MALEGHGHGTIITGGDAQGRCSVWVTNNGESQQYPNEEQCTAWEGGGTKEGDVVRIAYNTDSGRLEVTGSGARAKGNVDSNNEAFTVTDPGDTNLSGTILISTKYGENDGYGGLTNIEAANVMGKAAYLS